MGQLEVISIAGNPARHREHPILFVHGICHGAWCWQPNFAPYFSDLGYDVHAVSLRGHAGSPGRDALHKHRLLDYVDDVVEVAGTLDAKPIIIGHSMGGAITQVTVLNHPDLARAAVLFTPMVPGGLKVREVLRTARRGSFPSFIRLLRGKPLSVQQANALPFFDGRLDAASAALAADRLHAESWRALADIMRFKTARVPMPIPTLVVGSAEDSIFGSPALHRTANHYGIEPTILDAGCHDLMLDPTWRDSAGLLEEWMDKL